MGLSFGKGRRRQGPYEGDEERHGLETLMRATSEEDIREFLRRNPPSPLQAIALWFEECCGFNRQPILDLLATYRAKDVWKEPDNKKDAE